MILTAREPRPDDAAAFVARPADARECENAGTTVAEAIEQSVASSLFVQVVEIDGETAAIWGYGCASLTSGTALGWLLTTPVVDRYPVLFAKVSRRAVAFILARFPKVIVHVDIEHLRARAWLRWLGFKVLAPAEPAGFIFMGRER